MYYVELIVGWAIGAGVFVLYSTARERREMRRFQEEMRARGYEWRP